MFQSTSLFICDMAQNSSAQPMRAKGRVITSCLECYRRKQKCNRLRPCNFCSARGVPERCLYDGSSYQTAKRSTLQHQEHVRSPPKTPKTSNASATSSPPTSLLDQVGYSPASRRDQLECVGEQPLDTAMSNTINTQPISINDTDTYCSLIDRLPSKEATSELISVHFSSENWSFPILDEHYFRGLHKQFWDDLSRARSSGTAINLSPTLYTFPALLFSVLAVALQFVDPETDVARPLDICNISECDRVSQSYINTGQEIIEHSKQQKPTTTSIQYYLMKMAWLKTSGRGNEAWQSLGIALRQAQEIDFHRLETSIIQTSGVGVEQTLLRMWDLEHRKRLWARIFIMDSHMAMALGRPRGIHREDCSTPMPLDCDYPSDLSQTVPMSTNHTHEPPNPFSPVMFSIALGHKYHDLMSIRASKADLRDYSKVQTLHQEVQSLLSELPPALRPSFPDTTWDYQMPQLPALRQRLLTTANIFLLALHRPHISTHVASRHAATEAAFEILQAQQRLFVVIPKAHYKLYGYSFYTVDASIFLAAIVMKYMIFDFDTSTRALQALQQASVQLGHMRERSPIAKTGELILRRCCIYIEANIPSASSITNWESLVGGEMATGDGATNFLQEISSHVPDQATQELISLLADQTSSATPSTNFTSPLSRTANQNSTIPDYDLSTELLYSDLTTENPLH